MNNPKQVTITFGISTSPEMTCEQLAEMVKGTTEQLVRLISEEFLGASADNRSTTTGIVNVQVAEIGKIRLW